jgi:serine-type D-Ala-D-Ala carboxypeptidase/endopeptidase (penicillin-binding protein 4)
LKIYRLAALSLCVLLIGVCAEALDPSKINQLILKSRLSSSDFGMMISEDNRVIFALNAERHFTPASVTKVITGAATLELLGPRYKFRTQLLHDGSIVDNTIRGALYLRGGGDPSFHAMRLPTLLAELKKKKIKSIEGDFIVDDSRFQVTTDPQWQRNIQSLNSQMFPMFVRFDPPPAESSQQQTRIHRKLTNLEGRFVVYQNMIEPDLRTGQQLIQLMQKNGIRLKGSLKRGSVSRSARVLTEIASPSTKIVSHMLKTSNNFYADLLVRDIAAAFGERGGTFATGIDFLTFYLDHVNIPRSEYSLNSGSGFSHQNEISPRAMTSLLKHLKYEKTISSYFLASLPIAGVDGTLARRMKASSAKGRVRAKTGYLRPVKNQTRQLDGVVSLAGYATPLKGKPYTFVFFYNGNAAPETVKTIYDNICAEMIGPIPGQPKKITTKTKKKAPVVKKSTKKRTTKPAARKRKN